MVDWMFIHTDSIMEHSWRPLPTIAITTTNNQDPRSVRSSTPSLSVFDNNDTSFVNCPVCLQNQSRYTCPKCSMQYCSIKCYNNHNIECTESFYKNHVVKNSIGEYDFEQSAFIDGNSYHCNVQNDKQTQTLFNRTANEGQYLRHLNNVHNETTDVTDPLQSTNILTIEPDAPSSSNINNSTDIVSCDNGVHNTDEHKIPREDLIQLLRIIEKEEENNKDDNRKSSHQNETTELDQFLQSHKHLQSAVQAMLHKLALNRNNESMSIDDDHVQEWILDTWNPWWRTELITQRTIGEHDDDNNRNDTNVHRFHHDFGSLHESTNNTANDSINNTSLLSIDERLLTVPSFDTLRPRNKNNHNPPIVNAANGNRSLLDNTAASHPLLIAKPLAVPASPSIANKVELQYNLTDLLFCYCCLVRMYHGPANCIEHSTVHEIVQDIDATSAVLSKDVRYTCIEEVLVACTQAPATTTLINSYYTNRRNNYHQSKSYYETSNFVCTNNIILDDVACICGNHRYVARCLFEFIDIVKSIRINEEKENEPQSTKAHSKTNSNAKLTKVIKNNKKNNKILLRYQKKIEYYLSWSRSNLDCITALAHCIRKWISDWTIPCNN